MKKPAANATNEDMKKTSMGFRKTAMTQVGDFKPARKGTVVMSPNGCGPITK